MNEMDELHSIANYNGYCNSSFAWEFHNLGVLNADMSHSLVCIPPFISSSESDVSTGYLQDALFEFSSSKRRRTNFDQSFRIESCWKENCTEDYPDSFNLLSQINEIHSNISGKSMKNSSSSASGKNNSDERETVLTDDIKEAEEAISAFQGSLDSSSSSQTKYSLNKNNNVHSLSLHKETLYSLHGMSTSPGTFLFSLSLSPFIFTKMTATYFEIVNTRNKPNPIKSYSLCFLSDRVFGMYFNNPIKYSLYLFQRYNFLKRKILKINYETKFCSSFEICIGSEKKP
nr:PREDICTED: uncharacterized protein LOC108198834 isoform X1 [Daucus carota subsp. sativus]